jgi:hypothetical protein
MNRTGFWLCHGFSRQLFPVSDATHQRHVGLLWDSQSDTLLAKTFLYSGAAIPDADFWKFFRRGLAGDDMYPGPASSSAAAASLASL